MTTQKTIGVYLVDISGSMGGDRLANCKKFVTSMKDTTEKCIIYTYGNSPNEVTYDRFVKISATGGTKIEYTVNQMFTNYLLKEKEHLVDFILLTDAEDPIHNVNTVKANVAAAKQKYKDAGGKLDTSGVFVLKDGKWNDTAKKIKEAIGGADVFDIAALDKKLKETKQGIEECNHARAVYMECKAEIDTIKKNLKGSDDSKDNAKQEKEKKTKAIFENVAKVEKESDNNTKTLENELKDFSADFLTGIDEEKLDNIICSELDEKDETKETENKTESLTIGAKDEKTELTPDDVDDLLDEIDSDVERKEWKVGSKVEIFSQSTQKWIIGEITETFKNKNDEWVMVKYGTNKERELMRNSADIRAVKKGKNNTNAKTIKKKKNEPKTDEEIAQQKRKENLIEMYNKLQPIRNGLEMSINKLKSLLDNETAKGAIKKFDNLETLLNNITIQSVQSKVESMKQDLLDTKNDILQIIGALDKKAALEQTKVNEQISNTEKKRIHILKLQQRIKKEINKMVEAQLGLKFISGNVRYSKQIIVKNVLIECMQSNTMTVSEIRDKLQSNYMEVVVIFVENKTNKNIPDYNKNAYEYGRWSCGEFGIYDIVNNREKMILTEDESNAICAVEEMEDKCSKCIEDIIEAIENTRRNCENSRNRIETQRNKMIDIINKEMDTYEKKVKESEIHKLEIYNYNLNTAKTMQTQVKNVEIEFNDMLRNQDIPMIKRKPKIISDSRRICDTGNAIFDTKIAKSISDKLEMKFDENAFNQMMKNVGIVDNDILVHETVISVGGNEAQINIEYKSQDKIQAYALQYKEILSTDNAESVLNNYMQMMNDLDGILTEEKETEIKSETETKEVKEDKKENETEETKEEKEARENKEKEEKEFEIKNSKPIYMEFEGEEKNGKTLVIKNLKFGSKYCIRSKLKILGLKNWTNYSNIKLFEGSRLEIMGKHINNVKIEMNKSDEYTLSYKSGDRLIFGNIPLKQHSKWKWEVYYDKFSGNPNSYFGIDALENENNNKPSGQSKDHSYGTLMDANWKYFYTNNVKNDKDKINKGVKTGYIFEVFFNGPQKEISFYDVTDNNKLLYTFKEIKLDKIMYASFYVRSGYTYTVRNFRSVI